MTTDAVTAEKAHARGEPWITQPGQYHLGEAEYHADPVVGGSLSSTGAKTLTEFCPARFDYDRRNGRADKPHFDEGRAAHTELLGVGAPLYVPKDEDGEPYAEWRTKDAKAQVAAARGRGETPVKPDVARKVAEMVAALREHEIAGPLLARPGKAEQSFVARHTDKTTNLRARLDWMPDVPPGDRLILVDYKGTTCAHPDVFARRIADLGYDQQGAFYSDVVSSVLELELPPAYVLIAQEKEPPYLVTVHELPFDVIDGARELNREAIATYARCTETGVWPAYPPVVHHVEVPGWRHAAYESAAARNYMELIGEPA